MPDWAKMTGWQSPAAEPREIIRAAGFAVILASVAAALLPAGNFKSGPQIVGVLMVVVGLLEILANLLRHAKPMAAVAAGVASVGAGLLIFALALTSFVATVYVFIGWLAARGLLLAISAAQSSDSTKLVALMASATDFLLAGIAWTGLTASALVIALFGPTKPIIADFAWVIALSFIASGLLLVKVANEEPAA